MMNINGDTRIDQFAQYLMVAGQSPHTIRQRVQTIRRFALHCDPVTATATDVIATLATYSSAQTRSSYRGAFAAWFTYLQVQGIRDDDPMDLVPTIRVPRTQPRPVTDAQLAAILTAATDPTTRAIVLVMAYGGLRCSEANHLTPDDFYRDGEHWRIIIQHAKGGDQQSVPIPTWVVEQARAALPTTIGDCAMGRRLRHVFTAAGVDATPHALRHWYATTALRQSHNIRAVQTMLRHKSLASTQIYTQVTAHEVSVVSDQLPQLVA